MPIDRDEFRHLPDAALDIRQGTNAHRVMSFLAVNDRQAFTRSEVRDGMDIPDGSVGPVLSQLADDELVEHRGQYWTLATEQLEAAGEEGFLDDLREQWKEYL
ncbi:hypothetical protein BG842_17520 [Haladaptatus sp. W1]|uniref:hypothetical protein n=1 Tax=Haladaptatus sp. W1 TaxID=1897478 RepID=UPI000849E43A|nr:hypothetical protein [Haladaptatus sp. W1]ODR82624.1 hypothetical protein BG842_17520 [Haladaptatus sp. W1]